MEDAPPSAPKDDVVELNVEAGEGEKEASEVESHDASDNNIDNNEPPAEGPAVDFASLTKEEAKRTLSKKAYKEWKRQAKETKKEHHHHQHHHKDHAEKSALPKPEQKQRRRSRKESQAEAKPEEGPAATVDSSHNDDEPPAKKGRGELVSVAQRNDDLYDFDDPSAAQNPAQNVDLRADRTNKKSKDLAALAAKKTSCRDIINHLRQAREADQEAILAGRPPLYRLQMCPELLRFGFSKHLHEHLDMKAFLGELCGWLCDLKAGELAPIDLRSTALTVLCEFEFEFVDSAYKRKQAQLAARKNRDGADETDIYEGISNEQLKDSDIGRCINFIRLHERKEQRDNRKKATVLLERMTRTFRGVEEDTKRSKVQWCTEGDSTVANPFEALDLKTATEAFQERVTQVDPHDPWSYLHVPPKHVRRSCITGLGLEDDDMDR